tara:strand:- start:110 stop:1138 length:1029 start_codon:yes stop_codon:yes gene_type:complete
MSLKNSSAKIKIPKLFKIKLENKKIAQIYNKFEKSLDISEGFAVAVSGGPDSLALAFLSKIYSLKRQIKAKFFIVDHKLRPESSKEARTVKHLLKKRLINSEILTWRGKKPLSNIQSKARAKRYELLLKKCEKFKINNILIGHHQDDLIENFFLRMLRGSGLKGLVSLDKITNFKNKKLLRPLLHQKKSDLYYISKNVFNFYVQDPTNSNEKYQRIRVRKLIEELRKEGLDKNKFFKTVKNLRYSNNVVNFYVNKNLQNNTSFSKKNNRLVLSGKFFQQPYEIILRALSESIKLIGSGYYPARGKKIDRIISQYEKKQSFRVTLGGCILEKVNQTLIISKEY